MVWAPPFRRSLPPLRADLSRDIPLSSSFFLLLLLNRMPLCGPLVRAGRKGAFPFQQSNRRANAPQNKEVSLMSKFFSLAYLTLPNTHPVDQIEIAAQCGYEGGPADHLPAPARRAGLRPGQRPNVPDGPRCPGAHRREADGHRTGPGGGRGGRNELREGVRPGGRAGGEIRYRQRVECGPGLLPGAVREDVRSGGQIRHEAQSGVRPLLKHPRPDRSPGLDGPDGPAQCAGAGGHSARPPGEGHPRTAAGGSGGAIRLRPPVRRSGLHPAGGPPGHGGRGPGRTAVRGRGRHRPGGDAEEHP